MILKAPAKVNLHLEIKSRRPDGYHEILSIVQSVPLFDRVQLRSLKQRKALRIVCDPPLPEGKNIVAAVVEAFRRSCGIEAGIEVRIDKVIPSGAGLGGASSDAASVLLGLNRLFGSDLSSNQLHELAAGLGSDVPFFLGGGAALVRGRGETIRALTPRRDFILVLVYPGFSISTGEAYAWFDRDDKGYRQSSIDPQDLRIQYEEAPPHSWQFFNSFEAVVERRYPLIRKIVKELKNSGAHIAAVSGSGSSVLGLFTDVIAARSVGSRLRRRYPGVWVLLPLQNGAPAD